MAVLLWLRLSGDASLVAEWLWQLQFHIKIIYLPVHVSNESRFEAFAKGQASIKTIVASAEVSHDQGYLLLL